MGQAQDYRRNSLDFWNGIHKEYERGSIKTDDWLVRFDDILENVSKPVLDLGCGGGNDTLYLLSKGLRVIPCDQSENAISNIRKNFPEIEDARVFNMLDGLPFDDGTFDAVVADLCLHYFGEEDTKRIIAAISRVLTPGGHLFFRVNSVNDVNHGAGQGIELEHHVYESEEKMVKRFFDEDDIRYFFKDFEILYLHEEVMKRYNLEKILFRGCVRKPWNR